MKQKQKKRDEEKNKIEIKTYYVSLHAFCELKGKEFESSEEWKEFIDSNPIWKEFKYLLEERIPEIAPKVKIARWGDWDWKSANQKERYKKNFEWRYEKTFWEAKLTDKEFEKLREVCEELEESEDNPIKKVEFNPNYESYHFD